MSDLQNNLLNIKTQKDTYIIPENIKKDVTVLGVTGTLETKENLDVVLTQQETKLQELEGIVKTKTQGEAKPNVFCQLEEPSIKDGIWLQTDKEVDEIIADENVYAGEEWNTTKMATLKSIPYTVNGRGTVKIGDYVYLFGGWGSYTAAYKYNYKTDTYTQLAGIPYGFKNSAITSIGTDIYLFGTRNSNSASNWTTARKYDTLTDTYTEIAASGDIEGGSAVAYGTDIYIFGGYASKERSVVKYDTLTNTYTNITTAPLSINYITPILVEDNIYMLGIPAGTYYNNYKYNITTGVFTQLADTPYQINQQGAPAVLVNNDIYLFGGNPDEYKACKYNIETDSFTLLESYEENFTYAKISVVENETTDIYIFKRN